MRKKAYSIRGICAACIAALLCVFSAVNAAADEEEKRDGVPVPVLMYHSLNANEKDMWTLSPEAFEQDLRYLSEDGYHAVTIAQLVDFVDNGTALPEKPIVLSFDDGYYNNLAIALPLLKQYDMNMVLSVIGSYAEEYSETEDHDLDYAHLSWKKLGELSDTGRVELSNHTWGLHTHEKGRNGCCILPGEDMNAYREMLNGDVGRLQDKLKEASGNTPLCFTYPFGSKCPEALTVLQEMGFRATLSCYEGMNYVREGEPDRLYDMRRCNRTPSRSAEVILKELAR